MYIQRLKQLIENCTRQHRINWQNLDSRIQVLAATTTTGLVKVDNQKYYVFISMTDGSIGVECHDR